MLNNNDIVLFNGDSITDCGRDRTDEFSLSGYTKIIADAVRIKNPENNIRFFNRGIGGDTSAMLLIRLNAELAEIKPTVFSLLIGVNDTLRRYDSDTVTDEIQYKNNISDILKLVTKYTQRIIIMEQFLLPIGYTKLFYREDLEPKIAIMRKLATEYNAHYIPLDKIFAELSINYTPAIYSADGVHPTEAGNKVIAEEWLRHML